MMGFQVTFFTVEGRRHGHQSLAHWLLATAKAQGIRGATLTAGIESIGSNGRLHSAHFFELTDQPVEVTMALDAAQCHRLFALLEREQVGLFYVKTPVEFGVVGAQAE